MIRRLFPPKVGTIARRLRGDRRASAAVEFAMIAPFLCVILAAGVDFGGAVYARFLLNTEISAGANYALLSADKINEDDAGALASTLMAIVSPAGGSNGNATIVVNNAVTVSRRDGEISQSGSAANAELCYCPTIATNRLTWNAPLDCGDPCADGSLAGRFIALSAERSTNSLFTGLGVGIPQTIEVVSIVQVR